MGQFLSRCLPSQGRDLIQYHRGRSELTYVETSFGYLDPFVHGKEQLGNEHSKGPLNKKHGYDTQ